MCLCLSMQILHRLTQRLHVAHQPLKSIRVLCADAETDERQQAELARIIKGAEYAAAKGFGCECRTWFEFG